MKLQKRVVGGVLLLAVLAAAGILWNKVQEPKLTLYEQVEALVERRATMAEVEDTLGHPGIDNVRRKGQEIRWRYRAPPNSGYSSIVLEFDLQTRRLKSFDMYAI